MRTGRLLGQICWGRGWPKELNATKQSFQDLSGADVHSEQGHQCVPCSSAIESKGHSRGNATAEAP